MKTQNFIWLALVSLGSLPAFATGLQYTCDPNVDATQPGACLALNSTIAGIYNSTFTNANASIYIQFGATGLGESTTGFDNQVSYSAYLAALAAENGPGTVRSDALASLPLTEPALYAGANVDITSALGSALGFTGMVGTTSDGAICSNPGTTSGCYNGIITITNNPGTPLFYRNGTITSNEFDFFSVVEHETDEVLGTSSCVSTLGAGLSDGCPGSGSTPSAVDLYRYNAGSLVLIDTTPGAYFSYDGGATNGAGVAVYNTLADGNDYADFLSGCPNTPRVQDGVSCPGHAGLDITNDGGAEINILDAVGFNLNTESVPEPATFGLLGASLLTIALARKRLQR